MNRLMLEVTLFILNLVHHSHLSLESIILCMEEGNFLEKPQKKCVFFKNNFFSLKK